MARRMTATDGGHKKPRGSEPRGVFQADPRGSGDRFDHHIFAVVRAFHLKLNATFGLGEDGMVFTDTGIHTSVEAGATLTNDNLARLNQLATLALHAKAFTFGIATVTSTTTGFFMCHVSILYCVADQPWIPVIFTAVYHWR